MERIPDIKRAREGERRHNVWKHETVDGLERLVVAPVGSCVQLLADSLEVLSEPYDLLYVLVVPRCVNQPGRYQAKRRLSRTEVRSFLETHQAFLDQDGRHNVWVASEGDRAQVVYDRHNRLYMYGQLERMRRFLEERAFVIGPTDVMVPHAHHYLEEFDAEETSILSERDWYVSALHGEDEA
jgi:hypothetical protein